MFFLFPVLQLLALSVRRRRAARFSLGELCPHRRDTDVYLQVLVITFKIAGNDGALLAPARLSPGLLAGRDCETGSAERMILLGHGAVLDELSRPDVRLDGRARPHRRHQPHADWARPASPAARRCIYNKFGVMVGMVHAMMPLAVLTMLPVMTASTDA